MRVKVVVAAIVAGASALGVVPALASAGPSLPPVCVRQAVPNPAIPGAQIQVGYCP